MNHLWSDFNQHFARIIGHSEQVVDDGKVVDHGPGDNEEVPDCMGKRDSAVAFEKYDPDDIDDSAQF